MMPVSPRGGGWRCDPATHTPRAPRAAGGRRRRRREAAARRGGRGGATPLCLLRRIERERLLTRRARIASGTATQCTHRSGAPRPPPRGPAAERTAGYHRRRPPPRPPPPHARGPPPAAPGLPTPPQPPPRRAAPPPGSGQPCLPPAPLGPHHHRPAPRRRRPTAAPARRAPRRRSGPAPRHRPRPATRPAHTVRGCPHPPSPGGAHEHAISQLKTQVQGRQGADTLLTCAGCAAAEGSGRQRKAQRCAAHREHRACQLAQSGASCRRAAAASVLSALGCTVGMQHRGSHAERPEPRVVEQRARYVRGLPRALHVREGGGGGGGGGGKEGAGGVAA
eukprot:COSAG01_NODE_373_length_17991_cov_284.890075_21_plen_336_part_00